MMKKSTSLMAAALCYMLSVTGLCAQTITPPTLQIGVNVEAWDTDLDCLAALSTTGVLHRTGSGACNAGSVALTDLVTGTQDTVIGYFGATTASAAALPNCTGALIYSTSTHLFGCNTTAGTGTVTSVVCNGVTITTTGTCPPAYGFANCAITSSVSGNNLTVALKDNAGADPTAGSPCMVWFRSATAAPAAGAAQWVQRIVTAATSIVVDAGSTFGISNTAAQCTAASSCPFRLWVTLVDTGSTAVLGLVALTNVSGVLPLDETAFYTTTACSACATATALGTIYTTVSQTARPIALLGYLDWGSGLATAGTYASGPTRSQAMGPGVRKPGEIIQRFVNPNGAVSTGSNAYSPSDTPPAPANATSVVAQAITPSAAPNILRVRGEVIGSTNGAANMTGFIYDTTNAATRATAGANGGSGVMVTTSVRSQQTAGTSAITFTLYFATSTGTLTINGSSSARLYGGTASSFIEVEEIMG